MARIARAFIDDLISRVDICDYVDSYVKLKRAGKNHSACCPFHNEKSASFTVAQDKQFYHCFGCGAHGNVISFAMEYLKIEFVEAIEEVAKFAAIEVQYEASSGNYGQVQQTRKTLTEITKSVAEQYHNLLFKQSADSSIVQYVKSRKLDKEALRLFQIGYAPDEWQYLNPAFLSTSDQTLAALSLKSEKNGRYYDFFRSRLIFPIRNVKGDVVAFGGRVLGDGKPKYLNSSETEIFKKRQELYGLYEMRQSRERFDDALVVEGYMDVVSLHASGVRNTVAPLGTAITEEQIQKLFKYVSRIILVFDGDKAGRDAAERALMNGLPYVNDNKSISVVFMPEGEDPDTQIHKHGKDSFKKLLESTALPLTDFMFNVAYGKAKGQEFSLEYKASVGSAMDAMIDTMQESTVKDLISHSVADYLNVTRRKKVHSLKAKRVVGRKEFHITAPRTACCALLRFPQIAFEVELPKEIFKKLNSPGMAAVEEVYQTIHKIGKSVAPAVLIEWLRGSHSYGAFSQLMTCSIQVDETNAVEVLQQSISTEIDYFLKARLELLLTKSKQSGLSGAEKSEMIDLLNRDKS